jgi:hypothetical protein
MEPPASTAGAFPLRHAILDVWPAADGSATGALYLDDGSTRAYADGRSARATFRITRADGDLQLGMDVAGDRAFLPGRVTLRVHGADAVTGPARVRFGGEILPLRTAGTVAETEIPLR